MTRGKIAAILAAVIVIAVSPAKADGLPKSGLLPIGAVAADSASTPWNGFYIGAHAGYGRGKHEGTGVYTDDHGAYKVLDPETGKINLDGAIGGLQVGYNFQSGRVVYGIEGDFSWSGMNGAETFISDDGNNGSTDYTWNIKTDVDWLATLRGRIGVLVASNLLVYGTGGVAFAGVNSGETVIGFPPQGLDHETTVRASSSENLIGWVVGAGAEWAVAPRWTVKAEWQYLQFDNVGTHFRGTAYPDRENPTTGYNQDSFPGEININTIRLGLNYKLN